MLMRDSLPARRAEVCSSDGVGRRAGSPYFCAVPHAMTSLMKDADDDHTCFSSMKKSAYGNFAAAHGVTSGG